MEVPYAGGYITRHYGHRTGRHSLQIEINTLYCTSNRRYSRHAIREVTDYGSVDITSWASMASVMATNNVMRTGFYLYA